MPARRERRRRRRRRPGGGLGRGGPVEASPTIFHPDGERVDSTSTLRFRTEEGLRSTLAEAGFTGTQIDDLPYAPGRGWLVLARA